MGGAAGLLLCCWNELPAPRGIEELGFGASRNPSPCFQSRSLWPGGVVFPECVSGANEEPEEVSVAAKLPPEATGRSQETKENDDFSFSESEDEVSKDFVGSSGISSHNPCMCESLYYRSGAISAPAFCCNPSKTLGSESGQS